LPKKKPEASEKQPPKAMILEEYTLESDPWRTLSDKPGIRIINTRGGYRDSSKREVAWASSSNSTNSFWLEASPSA